MHTAQGASSGTPGSAPQPAESSPPRPHFPSTRPLPRRAARCLTQAAWPFRHPGPSSPPTPWGTFEASPWAQNSDRNAGPAASAQRPAWNSCLCCPVQSAICKVLSILWGPGSGTGIHGSARIPGHHPQRTPAPWQHPPCILKRNKGAGGKVASSQTDRGTVQGEGALSTAFPWVPETRVSR